MVESKGFKKPTLIAVGAIFAALVVVATVTLTIPIPATQGYFNLGETAIYVAALVFGPLVGAIAGAGASIADLVLGYTFYAPGTFVLKGMEGFVVGYLNLKFNQRIRNTTLSAILSILAGGSIMVLGYFAYEVAFLGLPVAYALGELAVVNIPQMVIGLIIAVPIMHAIQRFFPQLKYSIRRKGTA